MTLLCLSILVAATLASLATLHVYWAAGGRWGASAAVPEVGGKSAFTPGRAATLLVAALLSTAAALVLWRAGIFRVPLPRVLARIGVWGVAAVFALRAVGDFRLFGLFRKPSESRFARNDRRIYTPLCLALALACAVIAQ
jgi:hypothetical protein